MSAEQNITDLETLKIEAADNFEDVNDLLYRLGCTDGLPIVPPTVERVGRMLGGRDPAKVLAVMPPLRGQATLRKLAICAVMAGCQPDYLPILMAATEAVVAPEFNLFGIQTTTGSATPLLIVNGPIVKQCGLNAGANALGPGARSNATIGRAFRLVLQNIGGAIVDYTDKATMGQPGKYTFCFAENEAANPWEPLHVSRGWSSEQSTVTVVGAAGTLEIVDSTSLSAESVLTTMAHSMTIAGSLGGRQLLGGGEPLVLLAPEHAAIIAREFSRQQAQEVLFALARFPFHQLPPEKKAHLHQSQGEAETMLEGLCVAVRAADIMLVVVGGVGAKSTYVPTWGGSTKAVTRIIEGF
ncbi:MAG: hypothetical protein O7G88_17700 [bacterium]|nr:hypothetical protein [bacterium]